MTKLIGTSFNIRCERPINNRYGMDSSGSVQCSVADSSEDGIGSFGSVKRRELLKCLCVLHAFSLVLTK
jgi:hypothetical protein